MCTVLIDLINAITNGLQVIGSGIQWATNIISNKITKNKLELNLHNTINTYINEYPLDKEYEDIFNQFHLLDDDTFNNLINKIIEKNTKNAELQILRELCKNRDNTLEIHINKYIEKHPDDAKDKDILYKLDLLDDETFKSFTYDVSIIKRKAKLVIIKELCKKINNIT